jgi:hypothetical protein
VLFDLVSAPDQVRRSSLCWLDRRSSAPACNFNRSKTTHYQCRSLRGAAWQESLSFVKTNVTILLLAHAASSSPLVFDIVATALSACGASRMTAV